MLATSDCSATARHPQDGGHNLTFEARRKIGRHGIEDLARLATRNRFDGPGDGRNKECVPDSKPNWDCNASQALPAYENDGNAFGRGTRECLDEDCAAGPLTKIYDTQQSRREAEIRPWRLEARLLDQERDSRPLVKLDSQSGTRCAAGIEKHDVGVAIAVDICV